MGIVRVSSVLIAELIKSFNDKEKFYYFANLVKEDIATGERWESDRKVISDQIEVAINYSFPEKDSLSEDTPKEEEKIEEEKSEKFFLDDLDLSGLDEIKVPEDIIEETKNSKEQKEHKELDQEVFSAQDAAYLLGITTKNFRRQADRLRKYTSQVKNPQGTRWMYTRNDLAMLYPQRANKAFKKIENLTAHVN